MANISNHFKAPLTSVLAVICFMLPVFFAISAPNEAFASDPIFTVEDIQVDASAQNAIAAREKAFEQAQIKAFDELKMRMLSDSDLANAQTPPVNIISTMIKDFEITNEKLSAVRYIGTYTFRFKDNDVRRYFSRNASVAVSDLSSDKLLVLPFFNSGRDTVIWAPGNIWLQAWNRVPNLGGTVPLEVPIGDISDVSDISDNQVLTCDRARLDNMLARYSAKEAVIAIATPDALLSDFTNPQAIAQGTLKVEIYRTDRARPELVEQVNIIADRRMRVGTLYDQAVSRVRNALKKDWKQKTAIVPSLAQGNSIMVVLPIQSLSDWVKMQNELSRLSGLNNVALESLTPKQANVKISYNGSRERLNLTLAQIGMEVSRAVAADGTMVNILQPVERTGRYRPMRF